MKLDSAEQRFVYRKLMGSFNDSLGTLAETRWRWLMTAHTVGQYDYRLHKDSHLRMLEFAFQCRDWREMAGQLLRLLLVPLGHLSDKLPAGTTGRATVSAFKPNPWMEFRESSYLLRALDLTVIVSQQLTPTSRPIVHWALVSTDQDKTHRVKTGMPAGARTFWDSPSIRSVSSLGRFCIDQLSLCSFGDVVYRSTSFVRSPS